MTQALTPPFLVAALVLCVAGFAKLRAPAGAVRAASIAGLPSDARLVRVLALFELALGGWSLARPGPIAAGAVAGLYASFTAVTIVLARRQASCGCFGDADAPATLTQALLSGALVLVAVVAAAHPPHSLGWVLERPVGQLVVLLLGTAGALYGTVLAYTELPRAWASWSGP